MTGQIVDGVFHYNNQQYLLQKRFAVIGELVVTTPELFNFNSKRRKENDVSFLKPYQVRQSFDSSIAIDGKFSSPGFGVLEHSEYFVITEKPQVLIKTGESVVVKKFLGVTYYRKTTETFEYVNQN